MGTRDRDLRIIHDKVKQNKKIPKKFKEDFYVLKWVCAEGFYLLPLEFWTSCLLHKCPSIQVGAIITVCMSCCSMRAVVRNKPI